MFTKPRIVILSNLVSFLLVLALVQTAVPTRAQQTPQRERRVTASPAPTATPTPSATAEISVSPDETPQASPSPTPDRTQARAAATSRSLGELQSRITAILRKPELAAATIGIKITSLETGRVLFEENADKLLRPASNMKLYTVAAALDRLSPEYRFVTSVYAKQKPDKDGTVKGDLIIYGRGDPSIAARFNSGDYFKGIDNLATQIAAAGVKKVEGDLVGDDTYFTGPQYGSGWEWEDLTWYYGAEVSALTVNDNALDLSVKPGAKVGAPAVITTGPPDPLLRIVNKVVTAPNGTKRDLNAYRGLASDELVIKGSVALDDNRGYSGSIGISEPALLFSYLLRASLEQHGVTIKGRTRTIDNRSGGSLITQSPATLAALSTGLAPVEIVRMESVPLGAIAAQTLKASQNLYTELILRTLGNVVVPPANPPSLDSTSETDGLALVKKFLGEAGIPPASLVLSDGSGLSRNDMVTAAATTELLTYMHGHKYAAVFRDALPIAGVDGTLRNRFKGTAAENNLRAKTGTLSSATSLSGYVRDAAGEELAFSIMVNNYPQDSDPRGNCIEPIAILIASFAGKSQ